MSMQRRRHDMRDTYNRVMAKAWSGCTVQQAHSVPDAKALKSAVKRVWRKLAGKPCPLHLAIVKRGRSWVRYNIEKHRWEFRLNPKQGWHDVMHDVTHYLHSRLYPRDRSHCDRHLEMERLAAEIVVKNFFGE